VYDISVDIETTGTDPSHSNMIQLAAVKFDIETKTVGDTFDQAMFEVPNRWWDEGTRDWWMEGEKWDVYCGIVARARPPQEVLQEFRDWALKGIPGGEVRVWAKPISFEFPFLSSYYKQFGIMMPFHYRYAVDLNSYIFGRGHKDINAFWNDIAPVGDAHNALHDALYQIRGAFAA
jgi:DNA polymerase III alpha subunit (gram-positive type)